MLVEALVLVVVGARKQAVTMPNGCRLGEQISYLSWTVSSPALRSRWYLLLR